MLVSLNINNFQGIEKKKKKKSNITKLGAVSREGSKVLFIFLFFINLATGIFLY